MFFFFKAKISTQNHYLKTPKFLSPFIRQPLKTAFLLANLDRGYYQLSSLAGSDVLLTHTFMILDGQILVILINTLAVLKPTVDIQCL